MIARNESYKVKDKSKILILCPYNDQNIVGGLLSDLDRSKYEVIVYNFREKPDDKLVGIKEYFSPNPESNFTFSTDRAFEEDYIRELSDIVERENVDTVIPTKDKYVSLLARNREVFDGKLFLPSNELIELTQNKADTYNFFTEYGIPTPNFVRFNSSDPRKLEAFLNRNGSAFVKPASDCAGNRTNIISTMEEYVRKYNNSDGELIASEVLNLPEYTHVVIVKNGDIKERVSYSGPGSANPCDFPRRVVKESKLDKLGEDMVLALRSRYGSEDIEGIYNIDFLTNNDGNYILNEVNPGRLPGGHSVSRESGLNLSDALVKYALYSPHSMAIA